MATQQERELNDRLLALANSFASGDARIRDTIKRLIGAQNDVIDAYSDHLDQQRDWTSKEAKQAKEQLIRLKKIEEQEAAIRQQHVEALRRIGENEAGLLRRQAQVQDRMARTTGAARQQRLQQELSAIDAQIQQNQAALRDARAAYGAQFLVIKQAGRERQIMEAQQTRRTAVWGQNIRSSLGSTLETAVTKIFSPTLLGKAIKDSVSAVTTGAKTGGYGVSLNPFGDKTSVFGAAKLGLNPEEFIKLQAEMRRTILSTSGGMKEFVAGLNIAADKYSDTILDPAERTKVAAQQLEMFTKSGIRFVKEDAGAFADSMKQAAKISGLAPEQFNAALTSIIDDEQTQARLKAATTQQERRSILDGIQLQFAQNKALGMTTEQAIAASKALNKLAGQGPLDRYKQAARLRAYGSAMGMGNEANDAASILTKGKRATPEEQERLQKTLGDMSQALSQSATGSMGAEIFASTLADKLQLSQLLGPDSPFNVTLAKAVSPIDKAADTLSEIPPQLRELISMFNTLYSQATNNPLLTGAAGAVGLLGGRSITKSVTSRVGSMFSKGGGAAGSALSSQAGAVEGIAGLSSTTKAANILTKSLKVLGPIAAIGSGAFEGVDEYNRTGKMGRSVGKGVGTAAGGLAGGWGGGLAGAATGAAIGSIVPIVGTAAGAVVGGLLGAIGGGVGGGMLGGKAGAALGSNFDQGQSQAQEDVRLATTSTAEGIQQQVKQMDQNNDLLKKLADSQDKIIDLNEKQLSALTNAEKTQSSASSQASFRRDNRFGSNYGYVH